MIKFEPIDIAEREFMVDVPIDEHVTVELVRHDNEGYGRYEYWATRIDGQLYAEPRDLQGEDMPDDSPFVERVEAAFRQWQHAQTV